MAGVAPGKTHRPWVTSTTTSFGARVLTVSYKFGRFVSPSTPSVGAGNRTLSPMFGFPIPQVFVIKL